VNTGAPAKG